MPCPKNINISGTFSAYNCHFAKGRLAGFREYVKCTAKYAPASECIGCGKCEQHCPQHLPIREHLKQVQKEMENPIYRAVKAGVKKLKVF
jgi:predicted aldo/keto reductase-like oxidoreductase